MENIHIYDIAEKFWQTITLNSDGDLQKRWRFFEAVLYKDRLYLFGGCYSDIVCIDLDSMKTTYKSDVLQDLCKISIEKKDVFFRGSYILEGANCFLASALTNQLLRINLDTLDYEWISIGDESLNFSGICRDENLFWLCPRRNEPIISISKDWKIKKYELPDSFSKRKLYFSGIYMRDGVPFLPAINLKKSLIVSDDGKFLQEDIAYHFVKQLDNDELVGLTKDGRFFVWTNGERKEYSIEISDDKIISFFSKCYIEDDKLGDSKINSERSALDLLIFLNRI